MGGSRSVAGPTSRRTTTTGLISREGISIVFPERDAPRLEIEPGIARMRELVRNVRKTVAHRRALRCRQDPDRPSALRGPTSAPIPLSIILRSTPTSAKPRRHRRVTCTFGFTPNDTGRSWFSTTVPGILTTNSPNWLRRPPDIHLISIDLDVRDDRPENTSVIQVHAEGPGIAEVLVRRRHQDIGESNARRVANLSEGNARMALALAAGVRKRRELVRLFRHSPLRQTLLSTRFS